MFPIFTQYYPIVFYVHLTLLGWPWLGFKVEKCRFGLWEPWLSGPTESWSVNPGKPYEVIGISWPIFITMGVSVYGGFHSHGIPKIVGVFDGKCHYWLVVWNMFYFSRYWECHHPTWRTPSFFWGVETTNQMENAIQSGNCGVGNRQKKPYAAGFPPCISIPCALLAMTGPIVESHLVAVGLNDQLGDGHDLKRNNLFLVNLRSLFEKIPILFLVNYLYP